jgi:outer membrane biosynthesis protein TonB
MIVRSQRGYDMDKRWLAGLLLGCSMAVVAGSGHRTTMKDAEASMLLTGTIHVDPQGAVTGFTVDQRDKVPTGVLQLVDSTVPKWRFEPVIRDGQPVAATTTMSMLVVATQPDDSHYRIAINGATFGDDKPDHDSITSKSMKPPTYPVGPMYSGVSGAAYLVLRIDRLGTVSDVVVEQVNLRALGTPAQSNGWRAQFAESAARAARRWTFTVATDAVPGDSGFFSVRVPVDYKIEEAPVAYGHWQSYIPGPRKTIPWLQEHDMDARSPPDALVAGGVYQVGRGLHLLTPPGQG